MARVLVFTDRTPDDDDWKGAFAWGLIRALAESQHQVLVLTTAEPELIRITHPRLTIGRPAPNWGAQHLPKFVQGLIMFRPDVIHTFALKKSRLPSALTIWPYLHGACQVFPRLKRFSGFFEENDLSEKDSSLLWHKGSQSGVVFTTPQQRALNERFNLRADVLPVELELTSEFGRNVSETALLVPAPVSDWKNAEHDLKKLAEFLIASPSVHAKIVGGWGALPLSERRSGWQHLLPVGERVKMLESMSFEDFLKEAKEADSLWLECLPADSWRHVIAAFVGEGLGRILHGHRPLLQQGSTANFLNRLYSQV